CLQYASYPFTF
nr:immunoglobulin light chain junction region [Mus musculus]NSL98225.1 immunoglobulin light chain junction region [Mus musculus]NSL99960.1 immunoglobulin light chain junction region [Mus musculus]